MYFLEQVADQLYKNYGSSLNRHCLVFPNRRAGLFLMKHLAARAGKPLWAPRSITINELFDNCSSLTKAGNENLVFELYRVYKTITRTDEGFDNFYFWGEMLLNDFDDVDKYMVDAKALFTNLSDLHAIDEKFGWLTEEQLQIIKQFINNFRAGSETDEKRDFEFTWSVLYPLYKTYKAVLAEKGIAYEGMIFHEVASAVANGQLMSLLNEYDQYHFIGFNALNNCEKKVLKTLMAAGRAKFYWDYSDNLFFQEDTKAGFFVVPNIKEFGQDLIDSDIDKENGRRSGSPIPDIQIIDIPSDAGQAKLLPALLDSSLIDLSPETQHRTAIILADENLLPSVLSSIPPQISDINITMGYPFSMTVVYSLLRALLDLQDRPVKYGDKFLFDYRKVIPVLSNPLIARSAGNVAAGKIASLIKRNSSLIPASFFDDDPFLKSLFRLTSDSVSLCQYLKSAFLAITAALSAVHESEVKDLLTPEFLYRANQVLNRLEPLLTDPSVIVTRETFMRLADRIFREIKVPFRGEPLRGIQIMGLLESRSLDFDNLVIISANEGVLPKSTAGSSYIPYNLREAFGLPTINYQDSIYSYYFTRLLSRAKQISLIYNSSTEGLRTGEMSRFLLRLKYSKKFDPKYLSSSTRLNQRVGVNSERPRSQGDIKALKNRYMSGESGSSLSPSAINTWLTCRMKFYYAYVCDIREPDRITAGIDPAKFGTILHEVVSLIYKPLVGKVVTSETLNLIKKDKANTITVINDVLSRILYGGTGAPLTGTGLITADIVMMYLGKVLNIDQRMAPFTLISLEEAYRKSITIKYGNADVDIFLGGKIDRIDQREGIRRLIDYKTGSADTEIKSLDELFQIDGNKLNNPVVQTLIYCVIMSDKTGYTRLRPVIYPLRSSNSDEYEDRLVCGGIPIDDFKTVSLLFSDLLIHTVSEIFNDAQPFVMTQVKERCRYCPYQELCQR